MTEDEEIKPPIGMDLERIQAEAKHRREALILAGCSTYALGAINGNAYIVCLCCGKPSFNSNDIAFRYCVICHQYHHEWVRQL